MARRGPPGGPARKPRARAGRGARGASRGGAGRGWGRGGGSPFTVGSGGGVAVALLSRGAAVPCRQSQLQREQSLRPLATQLPAEASVSLAIFSRRLSLASAAERGGAARARSQAGPEGRSRP